MFGTLVVDSDTLAPEEKKRYQALYCGLCRQLGEEYGKAGRSTLTFDMTFLAILLSSVYRQEETQGVQRCPVQPLRRQHYVMTDATRYAADLNLVLAHYKHLDDWHDDGNTVALAKSKLLQERVEHAQSNWPRQCGVIADCLAQIGEMEKVNELNPDKPANCFGFLMGELFTWRDGEWTPGLRRMGEALGRFIYIMDACMDFSADIKKERYNPLIAQPDTDFEPMLTMLIGECTGEFESLPLQRDEHILRNILYSGVWVQYKSRKKGKNKQNDRSL